MSQTAIIGTAEAAEILGWSIAKTKRKAKAGEIPCTKLAGRTGAYVFDRADVERLAADEVAA